MAVCRKDSGAHQTYRPRQHPVVMSLRGVADFLVIPESGHVMFDESPQHLRILRCARHLHALLPKHLPEKPPRLLRLLPGFKSLRPVDTSELPGLRIPGEEGAG